MRHSVPNFNMYRPMQVHDGFVVARPQPVRPSPLLPPVRASSLPPEARVSQSFYPSPPPLSFWPCSSLPPLENLPSTDMATIHEARSLPSTFPESSPDMITNHEARSLPSTFPESSPDMIIPVKVEEEKTVSEYEQSMINSCNVNLQKQFGDLNNLNIKIFRLTKGKITIEDFTDFEMKRRKICRIHEQLCDIMSELHEMMTL